MLFVSIAPGAAAEPASPDRPDPAALRALADQVEAEARGDILPFWLKYTRNPANQGFYGAISNDLKLRPRAPRGALLSARVLWTFSTVYRRYRDPAYLDMARWAYRDLMEHFWDRQYGGFVWAIKADGSPLDETKQVYGQSFAIYSLAEYYRATGDKDALNRAIRVYQLVEEHSHDPVYGGYLEAFTRDWRRPKGIHLSHVGPEFAKSQNTHLHLMEAYANFYRAWPDPGLRKNLADLEDVLLNRIITPDGKSLGLFFDADWTPRSTEISYGHNIEANWLLCEVADTLGDPSLQVRARAAAIKLAHAVLTEGLDPDGAILILNDASDRPLEPNKEWWEQAEATTGFTNAYKLTGDPAYLRAAERSWDFIEHHLIDHRYGEWYQQTYRDGSPVLRGPKVTIWKCPYHSTRACLEFSDRLRELAGETP